MSVTMLHKEQELHRQNSISKYSERATIPLFNIEKRNRRRQSTEKQLSVLVILLTIYTISKM